MVLIKSTDGSKSMALFSTSEKSSKADSNIKLVGTLGGISGRDLVGLGVAAFIDRILAFLSLLALGVDPS